MRASVTSPSPYEIGHLPDKRRRLPIGVVVGVLLGLVALYSWDLLTSTWAFYICLAFMGVGALPIASRIAGGVERLLIILCVFSLQFYMSFNLMHADSGLPGGVQGLNISVQLLLAIAYAVVWLLNRSTVHVRHWNYDKAFLRTCVLFLATSALSFITSPDHTLTFFGFFNNIAMVSLALCAGHFFATRKNLVLLSDVLIAVLITQSIIFLIQRTTHSVFTMEGDVVQSNWGERAGGTAGVAPANVATLFVICLFFAETRLFSHTRRVNPLVIGAFGIGFLCLLLTLTRSAWIGFGLGSIFLVGDGLHRRIIRPSTVAILGVCLAVTLTIAYGPVHDRLDSNHHAAAEERWRLNYIGYEMIKAHPLFGVGINTIYTLKRAYVPSFFTEDDWIYIPHNQYIIVTAETGFIGLIGFATVLLTALASAWRARRSHDPVIKETATIVFVSICAMMWGMTLDFYAGMQLYVLLWFTLGTAAGVRTLASRENGSAQEMLPAA